MVTKTRAGIVAGLAVLFVAGCGGDDSEARPEPGLEVIDADAPQLVFDDPCAAVADFEFDMIDDFDPGDDSDEIGMSQWTNTDGSATEFDYSFREPLEGERCENDADDERVAYIHARGLAEYGGAFGGSFTLRDVSDWTGLSLWVRAAPESQGRTLFVGINSPKTDTSSWNEGGEAYCDDLSVIEAEKCDRFGGSIQLTERWQLVTLPFDRMKQRAFGVKVEQPELDQVTGINIGFEAVDWDIYVDEVAFYRPRTPAED